MKRILFIVVILALIGVFFARSHSGPGRRMQRRRGPARRENSTPGVDKEG